MTIYDAGSMTACIVLRCSIGLTLLGSPPKIASPKHNAARAATDAEKCAADSRPARREIGSQQ